MIDQKGIFNNIYKNLVTPILKKDTGIDAEYLTNFSLSLLTFSSNNRNWPLISRIIKSLNQEFCVVDKRLHQKICGIDFCNPVGLAAGFDKNGNAANIWKDFGFGFAEIGTVTKFAQSGNPKPRLFRLAKEQAALNRMGFNNNGAENLVKNFLKQNINLKKSIFEFLKCINNIHIKGLHYFFVILFQLYSWISPLGQKPLQENLF